MRRRRFTTLLGGLAGATATGLDVTSAARSTETRFDTYDRVEVASWDGTTLVGSLYVPRTARPEPAVLATHGYGNTRSSVASLAERYARNGFVALAYDSRGFGDSGGESSFDGPPEVADALSLVDALADGAFRLPDGETLSVDVRRRGGEPIVGMDGASYGGGIQLNTAAATPDSLPDGLGDDAFAHVSVADGSPLDAIVPRITWHDLLQAAAPDGVVKRTWDAFILGVGAEGYTRDGRPDSQGPDPRLYEFTAEAFATNDVSEQAEAYFAERSPDPATVAANDVATLVVQGWPDNLLTPNQGLATFHGVCRAGGDAAIVFYPGGHDDAELVDGLPTVVRSYLDAVSLAWMKTHLRGGRFPFPRVSLYQQQWPDVPTGAATDKSVPERFRGPWRGDSVWPPADAERVRLPLAGAAATDSTVIANSVAPTSVRGPTGSVVGSPTADAPVSSRAFDFEATADLDIAGTPGLALDVTPLGERPIVFGKLVLFDDRGRPRVIDEQVLPSRVTGAPGQRTTVSFDLVAAQRYLSAGERLRLVLAATDNGYASSRTSAGLRVHHGDDAASALSLSVRAAVNEPLVGRPRL